MKLWRALVFVLFVSSGALGDGVLQAPVAAAATPSASAPLAAEDAPTQARAFGEAYNLMLDHYVRPLDTQALLGAAWDQLAREAEGNAAAPGGTPGFTGDRAADLAMMRGALSAYLGRPGSSPD